MASARLLKQEVAWSKAKYHIGALVLLSKESGWFANKTVRTANKKGPNLKTGRCYRAKKYALPGISSHYAAGQYSDVGNDPIPDGYVIPILRNLQGHPEAPRLWSKHIDKIIRKTLGFQPTTHEPCLYFKRNRDGKPILLLRQ
eukprot:scaffold334_cov95-Cylindrotheca_fusiformis.AAC.2